MLMSVLARSLGAGNKLEIRDGQIKILPKFSWTSDEIIDRLLVTRAGRERPGTDTDTNPYPLQRRE